MTILGGHLVAKDDFAILVGINRYADSNLPPLDGPLRDVQLVYDWLVDTGRGNVPKENIETVISEETTAAGARNDALRPVWDDFLRPFERLILKPDGSLLRRPSSRLYLYLSGHGFCEKKKREPHAALYVANSSRLFAWNIYGTYFANWTKDQGLFGEIVLIMDACRDAKITHKPLEPPILEVLDVGAGVNAKLFELYAAPRGGKAQERPIPSRNNVVHGLLTHAFFDALEHASPGESRVSTAAIKGYLEDRWSTLFGTDSPDRPEVVVPTNGEIGFDRPDSADLLQRFKLVRLKAGDLFNLWASRTSPLSHFATVAIGQEAATVVRSVPPPQRYDIKNHEFVMPLPATFYRVIGTTAAGPLERTFQAGDIDVEL